MHISPSTELVVLFLSLLLSNLYGVSFNGFACALALQTKPESWLFFFARLSESGGSPPYNDLLMHLTLGFSSFSKACTLKIPFMARIQNEKYNSSHHSLANPRLVF